MSLDMTRKPTLAAKRRNSCWVRKGTKCTFIPLGDLESYLNDGWERGRIIDMTNTKAGITAARKGKIWINDGRSSRLVLEEDLTKWINMGFNRGRKKDFSVL